jgi:hypothetical protein
MKKQTLLLFFAACAFFSACKKTETTLLDDPLITRVKAYVKDHVSESNFSQLNWEKLIFFDKAGIHKIVKIPQFDIKKGTDKALYINIDSNGLSGNYFELNGSNTEAEITNASLDGRTK